MAQWSNEERRIQLFFLSAHPRNSNEFSAGGPETVTSESGWQTILHIASGETASPAGEGHAVTAMAWHIKSRHTGGSNGLSRTEALLAFAMASGPVGVVDLCPDGDKPRVCWSKVVCTDPIGVPTSRPCD